MKSKRLFIGVFFITACMYYYQYSLKRFSHFNNTQKNETEVTNNDLINTPQSLKSNEKNLPKIKVYETKDDKFSAFEEMEKNWLNKSKELLGDNNFKEYFNLRENCEKEKEKAYSAYHDYLRSKNGNNFKYNISEDQSALELKINEKYQDKLLKIIGEDKYKKYLVLKDNFNEELHKKSNGKEVILIEF